MMKQMGFGGGKKRAAPSHGNDALKIARSNHYEAT